MKKAILGVSAAAAIALAPLCIPRAQAHADDPCVGITDPAAHQDCINDFLPEDANRPSATRAPITDRWANFAGNFWAAVVTTNGTGSTLAAS